MSFVFLLLALTPSVKSQEGRGFGRIKGVVEDQDGNPIQNALVEATSLKFSHVKFKTKTDKKGEWAILGLGTGNYRVKASAKGYYSDYRDIQVKQLEINPEIRFVLKKIREAETSTIKDESSLILFEEGNKLFNEKKYEEAISSYKKFLEKNPKAYQAHINIGNAYKEMGELERALEEYNLVLEKAEGESSDASLKEIMARALAGIGEIYLKKQDFQNARKYLEKSIEVFPKDESLAYNVGEIYFSNQKIDEAIRFFELAKKIKPDWGKPYLKLGYAYLNKGDLSKAKENLEKFLAIEPDSPQAATARNILDYLKKQAK